MSSVAAKLKEIDAGLLNSRDKRYPLEGAKNTCTDQVGYLAFEGLKQKYMGRPVSERKMLRYEMTRLYEELRKTGRLFRRDGTRI